LLLYYDENRVFPYIIQKNEDYDDIHKHHITQEEEDQKGFNSHRRYSKAVKRLKEAVYEMYSCSR
jgi:hypothetical protein